MTLLCGFSLAACGASSSAQHNANQVDGPLTKVGQYTKSDATDPNHAGDQALWSHLPIGRGHD